MKKVKVIKTALRIPSPLYRKMKRIAKEEDRSLHKVYLDSLKAYAERRLDRDN